MFGACNTGYGLVPRLIAQVRVEFPKPFSLRNLDNGVKLEV